MKNPYAPLDEEEKKLMESLEKGEWVENPTLLSNYQEAINRRISLNFKAKDLELIKEKAKEAGIPYQTLISSIIHRYVTGKKDKFLIINVNVDEYKLSNPKIFLKNSRINWGNEVTNVSTGSFYQRKYNYEVSYKNFKKILKEGDITIQSLEFKLQESKLDNEKILKGIYTLWVDSNEKFLLEIIANAFYEISK